MSRLILDHYRRWWRVLAVAALAEVALGALIALGPQYTFEFWAFMLSLWAGATLLSFDLQRGALRPMAVLPLTGRQLGRGWWVATVPIPAVALAALLFLGASLCCHWRPGHQFPAQSLVLASLFTLVWLGVGFTLNFSASRGFGRTGREFWTNSLMSWVTVLVFFGSMVLCTNASRSPGKTAVLLGLGALLTLVGWWRAERFEPGRAGLWLGRIEPPRMQSSGAQLTPLELGKSPAQFRVPVGFGGVRFLLSTVTARALFQIVSMVALMVLIFEWQGRWLSVRPDVPMLTTMGTIMPGWFLLFYQFMPMVRHLRVLRTMPISASALAVAMLGVALLPMMVLGALAGLVAWASLGGAAALAFLNCYVFVMAPMALCVFFAVWRGGGTSAYALVILMMIGLTVGHLSLQTRFHYLERPLTLAGPMAVAGLLVAFALTRQALVRSRQAYRAQGGSYNVLGITK